MSARSIAHVAAGTSPDFSGGSRGAERAQEERNRMKPLGYLRLLRDHGQNRTPSLEVRGGGGVRPRAGKKSRSLRVVAHE